MGLSARVAIPQERRDPRAADAVRGDSGEMCGRARSRGSCHLLNAIRGPVLTYTGDAFRDGLESTMRYEPDAIVAMRDGKITHFGPASEVRALLPPDTTLKEYGRGHADPGRLHRLPRALSADADHRRVRRSAHRVARQVHLRRRAAIRRPGACARGGAGVPAGMSARRHDLRRGLLHGASTVGRRVLRGSRRSSACE